MSLAIALAKQGEQVGRRLRMPPRGRTRGRRPTLRQLGRGAQRFLRQIPRGGVRRRRARRGRGISGAELRGFRKVARLLATWTGTAVGRGIRRSPAAARIRRGGRF